MYKAATAYVAATVEVVERIPRRRAFIADQLLRAATSIPLNIAEGAGEYRRREKARFYRIARRSATESAAILDVLATMQMIDESTFHGQKELLDRITAMLTRMAKSFQ
ncbi:MAG: four helix bundle protein [Gemmatimonadota bacterium]